MPVRPDVGKGIVWCALRVVMVRRPTAVTNTEPSAVVNKVFLVRVVFRLGQPLLGLGQLPKLGSADAEP